MTPEELARLQTLEDMVTGLIASLAPQPAPAGPAGPGAVVPVTNPQPWISRASQADRDVLANWVTWLNASHSLSNEYAIPGCWQEHPGIVEELAAIHEAWVAAMLNQATGMGAGIGSIDAAIWYTQTLWPCLERVSAHMKKYQIMMCHKGHTPDRRSVRT